MAHLIVIQPNGNYSVFSTITDTFVYSNLSKEDLFKVEIENAMKIAKQEKESDLIRAFAKLETKGSSITYLDALEMHRRNS